MTESDTLIAEYLTKLKQEQEDDYNQIERYRELMASLVRKIDQRSKIIEKVETLSEL